MSEKIAVFLKMRDRGDLNFVLKHVNYYLGVFSDTNKYQIFLYNENIKNLPDYYNCYNIINRNKLLENVDCKKYHDLVEKSDIDPRWKGAAFALGVQYIWLKDHELSYGVDSEDTCAHGPAKYYMRKLEEKFKEYNLDIISFDLHNSLHMGDFISTHPSHWTFGLCLARNKQMKNIVLKSLAAKYPTPPWQTNIDHKVGMYLETYNTPYISCITKDFFTHTWGEGNHYKSVRYLPEIKKMESTLLGKVEIHDKHPRTLLIE